MGLVTFKSIDVKETGSTLKFRKHNKTKNNDNTRRGAGT